jgi:hypothetical protein
MQSEFVEILQHHRTVRFERERENQVCSRIALLDKILRARSLDRPKEIIPATADVARFPEFREILEASVDFQVDQDTFTEVLSQLPKLTADWSQKIDESLIKCLPVPPSSETNMKSGVLGMARLWLATTFFRCSQCNRDSSLLQYPRVLVHQCLRGTNYMRPSYNNNEDHQFEFRVWRRTAQLPWMQYFTAKKDLITYDKAAAFVAKQLILACKKDPNVITAGEMDSVDARFVCPLCIKDGQNLVLSWAQAVGSM